MAYRASFERSHKEVAMKDSKLLSAHDFSMEFAKAIIHNVDTRPQIVKQWTEKLEAREAEIGRGFYERFCKELNIDPESYHGTLLDAVEAARRAAGVK